MCVEALLYLFLELLQKKRSMLDHKIYYFKIPFSPKLFCSFDNLSMVDNSSKYTLYTDVNKYVSVLIA